MSLNRYLLSRFQEDLFTGTDIVKMIVILSFSTVSLMLTAVTPEHTHAYLLCPLTYCIPIALVALWFPRQGFPVTAFLIFGFLVIRICLSILGFTVDLLTTGLHTIFFIWVFGVTTLFSRSYYLTVSRCRRIAKDTGSAKFLCDPETLRLRCVNSRCADLLGYTPSELIGLPVERLWADEDAKIQFIEEMKRDGGIGNAETTFRARNGSLRPVLLSCRSLVPENLFECTVVDIGRLQGEYTDPVRSNRTLTELIRQSNDIFFVQDAAGRILHFSWLRAPDYGISPDDLIGRGADALLPEDLARQHMERVRKAVDEQKNARYNLDLELAGVRHTFSVTIAPYTGVEGVPIGVVGSAHDATEMRRQRLACRQMTWEVDQWKGLATTLSHELRTPLQPLIGYLQMIVEDPGHYGLTKEVEKYLANCLVCSRQEQAVVEKVVELSLLTMDHIEFFAQEVPLRRLADTIVSRGGYDPDAQISNEIPDSASIWGDRDKLSLALECLVSNAVKYNEPPKNVWIRYAESNNNHYIMVCDNGIGIPADVIESIFGPFSTGNAGKLHRKSGKIGLGLMIARKYVRLHGGEITVTSVVGEGSTFTIRIPKEV